MQMGIMLNHVLELPNNTSATAKAWTIIKVIVQSMKDALLRGEEVHIQGLGTLKLHTKPQTRKWVNYSFPAGHKNPKSTIMTIPPKTYVTFIPSRSILSELNRKPTC